MPPDGARCRSRRTPAWTLADVAPLDDAEQGLGDTRHGHADLQDDFPTTLNLDGCGVLNGYASYGDAGDWLYKDYRTRALSIEAYNKVERGTCPTGSWDYNFGPVDAAKRDTVADNNVQGGIGLLRDCTAP